MLTRLLSQLLKPSPKAPAVAAINPDVELAYKALFDGDSVQAERICRTALTKKPTSKETTLLLSRILAERGSLGDAKNLLDPLLARSPNDPDIQAALGNVCRMMGENTAAAAHYAASLGTDPRQPLMLLNFGRLQIELGQEAEGLSKLRVAVELQPDLIDALKLLVPKLLDQGENDEAIALLNRAAELQPRNADILNGLGFAWQRHFQPEKALDYYRQALKKSASDHEIWDNYGTALQDLMRLDEAIVAYDKAISLRPDHPIPRWHRSLAYLLQGDFEHGWPDYELRLFPEQVPAPRQFPYPRWRGELLADKTILVYAEQGLGDEIMFSSCLPDLVDQAGHVIVECARKLAPILARSFPTATIHGGDPGDSQSWLATMPPIDLQVPIGSLPLYFRKHREALPLHTGYLKADPAAVAAWRKKLDAFGPGLAVGISWRGGTRISRRQIRSINLEDWLPILSLQGVHFVSLQYDEHDQEIQRLANQHGIRVTQWKEALDDFGQTVALVSALDLVVGVCTTVIHLSGALNKEAWVLVPACPEWRYGAEGTDMPWYPSIHLYRQRTVGEWAPTISGVAGSLSQRISQTQGITQHDSIHPAKS